MRFELTIAAPGETTPRRETLLPGSYIIGRGAAAKIRLSFPEISERHALLVLTADGQMRLEDLHSANGTYINAHPIDALVTLAADHVIQIGSCYLRLAPSVAEKAPAPPATEPAAAPRTAAPGATPPPPPAPTPAADPLAPMRRQAKELLQI